MTAPQRRSNWTMAAFAAPCLPMAGLGLPLVVYLPEFYSSELGLSLAQVGAAFGAVRLLDMAFDPFIGGVMDGTRTRFGRFRPWFALGAPILMLATYMLFMAHPGVGVGYLWTWLLVLYAGVSIASLSQLAWGAAISPHYDQRSRVYGWWQGGNVIGMILVLTLPALLPYLGVKGHAEAVGAMGWFVVALLPITVALAVARVPEPVSPVRKERSGLGEYFKLLRRPSVARLLVVDFLVGTDLAVISPAEAPHPGALQHVLCGRHHRRPVHSARQFPHRRLDDVLGRDQLRRGRLPAARDDGRRRRRGAA